MNHHSRVGSDLADNISRCVAGDVVAVEQLYRDYHEELLAMALRYVHDVDAARDVEHDAWVMILTSLPSLRDTSRLSYWMSRIVRNTALNYLKHEKVARRVPLSEAASVGDEPAVEAAMPPVPVMMDMVARLPQGYEQVFRLYTFEGLTHEQIGALLGIAAVTSRSQLSRARGLLQQMLRRYWALAVVALLAPIAALLLMHLKKNKTTAPAVPVCITQSDEAEPVSEAVPRSQAGLLAGAKPVVTISGGGQPIAIDTVAQGAGNTAQSDSLAGVLVAAGEVPARMVSLATMQPPGGLVVEPCAVTQPQAAASSRRTPWQMHLAYGANGGMVSSVTDNFLSMVNYAGGESARDVRLYTWGDYYRYVDENASLMDSVDALRMTAIAQRHRQINEGDLTEDDKKYNDPTPLSETKHHERPRTLQLSLAMPLTPRWSISSGLGFTWMKSTFEADNGNGNDITRRTQRLYYVSLPLGATYTIWRHDRLSLYATGNLRLDVPVRGRETTEWVYIGPYEHAPGDSLVFPTTHAAVKAPWQWSVGAGVGVQYQLLPHVKAYFEPGFRYYFPTGSPVETYRNEHPLDVTFPFGIRITP